MADRSTHGNRLYIAVETFKAADYPNAFIKEQTRVREGHPILAQFPSLFRLADAHYEWPEIEQATAGPGERRGAKANV